MEIDDLLRFMVKQEASDLHLKPMRPPLMRIKGRLLPLKNDPLTPDVIKDMIYKVLSDKQRTHLEDNLWLDFGYSLKGVSRFRSSVYFQRGTVAAVFRRLPFQFPTLDEWGLPEVLKQFGTLPHGLVLLAGSAGSGKSSTLAAIARDILGKRLVHVITIEDPIEFLLSDDLGSASQREVGTDTRSFNDALRNALRQDPDVIVVGEMLDPETIATVMTAAETGHLVFSTVHASSAPQTIERVVDAFPESQQRPMRSKLGQVLQGIVAMQLVERADGQGLVAAVEILRKNPKVSRLIQQGLMSELHEEIEASVSFEKMQSMNQSLAALVINGAVTVETALAASPSPSDLDLEIRKFLRTTGPVALLDEDDMAESQADYSKVLELREIRRMYEEMQERYRQEMTDKDALIASLRQEMEARGAAREAGDSSTRTLQQERDKLAQQLSFQKQEYEGKIEKLQLRIKELTAPAESRGGGLFRR
jgi:twitching motility protein PilT